VNTRRHSERGFVLVIVLGVLALLTVLTLGFARRALLERRAAAVSLDHSIAMSMARGAVQRGIADLRNRAALEKLGARGVRGAARPSMRRHIDPIEEGLYAELDIDPKDTVDYTVDDIESRISLNHAPEAVLDEVDLLSFVTVGAILERREKGADGRANTPFLVPEELMNLEHMDDEDWYGADGEAGARDLITVWGDGFININTAPAAVLECIPETNASTVEAIVAYRRGNDGIPETEDDRFFTTFDEIPQLTGISLAQLEPFRQYCKLNSRFFTITGLATRRQGKVRATCTAVAEIKQGKVEVLQWREGPVGS